MDRNSFSLDKLVESQLGVLNAVPDQIVVLDIDGNIIFENSEWKRFAEENGGESYVGKNYFQYCLQTDDDNITISRLIKKYNLVRTGNLEDSKSSMPIIFQCTYAKGNRVQWYEANITKEGDYILIMHRNITKEKIRELNLDIKMNVMNWILHDVKNPISTFLTSIEMFQHGIYSLEQTLEMSKKAGEKLTDILSSSIPDINTNEDKYSMNYAEIDIQEEVENSTNLLKVNFPQIKFRYINESEFERPIVYAGRTEFISILDNMLKNAYEASKENSEVVLRYKRTLDEHIIEVYNDVEIPMHLKDRFFQKTTSTKSGGNGLGTYLIKTFTEFHGGKTWFKSSENYGTSVYVSIPIYEPKDFE